MNAVAGSGPAFAISLTLSGSDAVIAPAGELDAFNASGFATVVGGVIRGGYPNVVLDLAELRFIDAAGLRVLTTAAAEVLELSGNFCVEGASLTLYRVFEVAGLTEVLGVRWPHVPDTVAETQEPGARALTSDVVHSAAAADRQEAIDDTLRQVTSLVDAAIADAHAVSVTVRRGRPLITAAADHADAFYLDQVQYAAHEGPCVQASTLGQAAISNSLPAENRWSEFVSRARARGILSVFSTPLIVGRRQFGALNVYSRALDSFSAEVQELAGLFACHVGMLLSQTTGEPPRRDLDRDIRAALDSRAVIAQAQGVLMALNGFDATAAHRALRRSAARTATPLRERAEEIIAELRTRSEEVTGDRSH